jgi:CheY-like chemotaxis protein
MSEMTGQEVLKALKDQQVDFPIVVVTADIQETVRVECMELGARYFLNKPVKSEELQTILRVVLRKQHDGAGMSLDSDYLVSPA